MLSSDKCVTGLLFWQCNAHFPLLNKDLGDRCRLQILHLDLWTVHSFSMSLAKAACLRKIHGQSCPVADQARKLDLQRMLHAFMIGCWVLRNSAVAWGAEGACDGSSRNSRATSPSQSSFIPDVYQLSPCTPPDRPAF